MPAGPTLISIDAFPESGQRQAWGDALGSMGFHTEMAGDAALSGDVGVIRSPSGARLARLRSTPQKLDSSAPEAAMRRVAPLLVVFHHMGRGDIGGREFAEGDVSVADRAEGFTLNLREDFDILVLEIPRKRLLSRLGRVMVRLPAVLGMTSRPRRRARLCARWR